MYITAPVLNNEWRGAQVLRSLCMRSDDGLTTTVLAVASSKCIREVLGQSGSQAGSQASSQALNRSVSQSVGR